MIGHETELFVSHQRGDEMEDYERLIGDASFFCATGRRRNDLARGGPDLRPRRSMSTNRAGEDQASPKC